jgi:hypothetical protein
MPKIKSPALARVVAVLCWVDACAAVAERHGEAFDFDAAVERMLAVWPVSP